MRLPSKSWCRLPILAVLLPWFAFATAQELNGTQLVVSPQQLLELRATLQGKRARLVQMAEVIDTAPAQSWLQAGPAARFAERMAATDEASVERSMWQAAIDLEMEGAERLRGALERADLTRAAGERIDVSVQRITLMLGTQQRTGDDTSLSAIEADIAALERRRAQVALEQEQKRQTLERLEAQARTQSELLERLRQELAAGPDALPWGPLEDEALSDALAAWEQAQARRAEARLLGAQLDGQTAGPRTEFLRLELRVLEIEAQWLAQRMAQLSSEYAERSGEELRTLREDLRRVTEREPEAAQRFSTEIEALLKRIDRIAQVQGRVRELQAERERYTQMETDLTQTLAGVT